MKYLVIGLGIYGSNLAVDLTGMGHEVIGADVNASIVEGIKNSISTAYILDAIDETSLRMLPLTSVDLVIVAIGENFGASVRTVALLKKAGVKHIYARAIDPLHEAILEGFHIDRIITPEQRAARDLVCELALGTEVASLHVAADTYVLNFAAPAFFHGLRYADLDLDRDYGMRLIAVSRRVEKTNIAGMKAGKQIMIPLDDPADLVVEERDAFTVVGRLADFRSMCRRIS